MLEIWIEFGLLKSKTVSNTFFVLITLCAEEAQVLHGPGKDRGRATTRAKGTLRDWYVIHNTRINDSRGFSRAGRHPASHDGETSPPSRSGIHRSTPAPVNTPSQPLHDNEIPEPVTNTVNTEFSNEFFSEPFSEPSTAATKAVQSPTKAASPSHRTQTKITTITRTACPKHRTGCGHKRLDNPPGWETKTPPSRRCQSPRKHRHGPATGLSPVQRLLGENEAALGSRKSGPKRVKSTKQYDTEDESTRHSVTTSLAEQNTTPITILATPFDHWEWVVQGNTERRDVISVATKFFLWVTDTATTATTATEAKTSPPPPPPPSDSGTHKGTPPTRRLPYKPPITTLP
ncbi:hypothetical protein AWENTII_002043 [Aspergillus wentii]